MIGRSDKIGIHSLNTLIAIDKVRGLFQVSLLNNDTVKVAQSAE